MSWILESGNYSIAYKIDDKFDLQCSAPYDGRPLVPVVEILVVSSLPEILFKIRNYFVKIIVKSRFLN